MADLNFSLLPWQQTVFQDKTRFKVVAAGRRCGKSRMAAVTLLIEGLKCPQGSAVLYVSQEVFMGFHTKFIGKPMEVSRKLPSRVGVEKVDREKAKEYCRMAQLKCPPLLRTGDSRSGSVPTSLTQVYAFCL